jgi:hypothetical protein
MYKHDYVSMVMKTILQFMFKLTRLMFSTTPETEFRQVIIRTTNPD